MAVRSRFISMILARSSAVVTCAGRVAGRLAGPATNDRMIAMTGAAFIVHLLFAAALNSPMALRAISLDSRKRRSRSTACLAYSSARDVSPNSLARRSVGTKMSHALTMRATAKTIQSTARTTPLATIRLGSSFSAMSLLSGICAPFKFHSKKRLAFTQTDAILETPPRPRDIAARIVPHGRGTAGLIASSFSTSSG